MRRPEGVFVNRSRARVEPCSWWFHTTRNGFAQHARGLNTRIHDRTAILRGVTAIHRASDEIDDRFRTFQHLRPFAQGARVPHYLVELRAGRGPAPENPRLPSRRVQISCQQLPEKSTAARKNDARSAHSISILEPEGRAINQYEIRPEAGKENVHRRVEAMAAPDFRTIDEMLREEPHAPKHHQSAQIGRASCRERV